MWQLTREGDASTGIGRAALLVSEEKCQRGGSAGAAARQGPRGALAGTPARRGHGGEGEGEAGSGGSALEPVDGGAPWGVVVVAVA